MIDCLLLKSVLLFTEAKVVYIQRLSVFVHVDFLICISPSHRVVRIIEISKQAARSFFIKTVQQLSF